MKLPSLYVDGFDDCQLNFETLQTLFSNPSSQPLSFLQLLTASNLQLSLGTTTLTWTASTTSANVVVAHGLPRTPKVVIATANSSADNFYCDCFSIGATTFTMQGQTATAVSLSGTAAWIAIG